MGKRIFNLLAGLVGTGLLLASCSGNDDTTVKGSLVTRNDFENVLGWGGGNDPSVSSDRAHSGKFSVKVGPQSEYGYTYIQTLGRMSTAKAKDVTVSAWVWLTSEQDPSSIVMSITRSPELNTPVFYGSVELAKEVKKFKTWQLVTKTFTLPDSVQATNQLKCYLWRVGSNENVYADDLTLSIGN